MGDDSEQIERIFRIEAMKGEIEELTDGRIVMGATDELPPEMEEQFWEQVLEFERAPMITNRARLERSGVVLHAPEELTDEELSLKLIEVIHTLADNHIYLESTDHLSDRALYQHLWQETLDDTNPDLPLDSGMNCHIDLVSSGSEEDILLMMQYYADEETRQQWQTEYPDYPMPPHEDPPYHRDSQLPKAPEM